MYSIIPERFTKFRGFIGVVDLRWGRTDIRITIYPNETLQGI